MKTIQLTKGFVAKVDDEDYHWLSTFGKWTAEPRKLTCYAKIRRNHKTVYMHQLIAQANGADHKDGDGLNNQRSNLRLADSSQQHFNQRIRSDNTTGHKGVSFYKRTSQYVVNIRAYGKNHHFGYYDTLDEAAKVAYQNRQRLHGEFCRAA